MKAIRPITIVGGGLAGLTLGLGLRQAGVPVTIYEAGSYPRHRVCGEFVCGRGLELLRKLGMHQRMIDSGAIEARSAAFFSARQSFRPKTLPRAALCLSRFVMDDLLAEEFRGCGGQLLERERVSDSRYGPGIVRATGRRVEPGRQGRRWIGLKAHACRVELSADLEMHFAPVGYIGLCRLAGGRVNVCGLFAFPGTMPQLANRWNELLRGAEGSPLRERMGDAEFLAETFCAVSGLRLRPASASDLEEISVGDALTMIPPVTGNGMSMAFESAEWAIDPLAQYSRGKIEWPEAKCVIARRCDDGFARRLVWASWLQWALMDSGFRDVALGLAARFDGLWRFLFDRTR